MHITITIMTGSKNHEKWCIIHGGVLLNLKLWWTLQPLKGKANNGGKTCFPRCSQIFFFDKTLFYHKMNHFKLKNPCGSLRQFFFPKRGKPKFANCTLCILNTHINNKFNELFNSLNFYNFCFLSYTKYSDKVEQKNFGFQLMKKKIKQSIVVISTNEVQSFETNSINVLTLSCKIVCF